jgi:hypothetical protein
MVDTGVGVGVSEALSAHGPCMVECLGLGYRETLPSQS